MTKPQLIQSLNELDISLEKLIIDLEKNTISDIETLRIAEKKKSIEFYKYDGHHQNVFG